jgi:hypothetical protein
MWHAWETRENCTRCERPKKRDLLENPRRRREDGIRMNLRETGLKDAEWVLLAQDRGQRWAVVNAVMNLSVLAPRR